TVLGQGASNEPLPTDRSKLIAKWRVRSGWKIWIKITPYQTYWHKHYLKAEGRFSQGLISRRGIASL
ncbi:hypothetical protein, partial [Pseudomonas helleri]|uniref:hypothetical protein n=1 Tax=Pseudomonas helleri TaxID=1608996 RepID=UPI003FD00B04